MFEKPSGLCLEWKNLNYYVPAKEENNYSFWQECQKKEELQILHDVSGHMKTGDLVAILGCSGAGKTTLLAAISQRLRGNLTGDVVLNGVAMERHDMTRISSFLPQFEIHVKTFTAFEHLYFMSHFKMHRKTTKAEKRERVNDLLYGVGLRDAANTRIMQLSGGERKRLSLAEELITDPLFLFCDEPTTGLDSYSAYIVVKTLRHLCTRQKVQKNSLTSLYADDSSHSISTPSEESREASIEMEILASQEDIWHMTKSELPSLDLFDKSPNGHFKKSIICSIHQPSSEIFELFTHIILMDAGRIIYQGSTEMAAAFFSNLGYPLPLNCNPADFYLKTISDSHTNKRDGEIVRRKYEHETNGLYSGSWLQNRPYAGDYLSSIKNFKKIRWIYQVYLLLMRFITEDSRNIKSGLISLAIFMVTSLTLTGLYSGVTNLTQKSVQDTSGLIFMLTNELIFSFSYGVAYIIPDALPIIRREVGEGIYSLSAYFVAVVLSFVPVAFFKTYLFFGVVYGSIYYVRGYQLYLTMGLALSMSSVAASGYGLFLSSIFETSRMSTECAAPFDLFFLLFAGAYYNVDSIPFVKYLSLFFYANESIMYEFWIDVDKIECPENLEHPCIENGLEVLQMASFKTYDGVYWVDLVGLLVVAAVFNIIAYFFMRKYVKRSGYY